MDAQLVDFDYDSIYQEKYYTLGQLDGLEAWKNRTLKFGDNLAALCYALYIEWDKLVENFPLVFEKNKHGYTNDHPYTIENIIDFLKKNKSYTNNILEVGGGRGELSNLMTYLNINHTSIEVYSGADKLYAWTGEHYFGPSHKHTTPIIGPIEILLQKNLVNLSDFSCIIFPESVEHIPTQNFNYVMDRIASEFKGRFIVTNWKYYHPIVGTLDQPGNEKAFVEEHVADVNDEVYAKWTGKAKKLIYKDGSHLVLEF